MPRRRDRAGDDGPSPSGADQRTAERDAQRPSRSADGVEHRGRYAGGRLLGALEDRDGHGRNRRPHAEGDEHDTNGHGRMRRRCIEPQRGRVAQSGEQGAGDRGDPPDEEAGRGGCQTRQDRGVRAAARRASRADGGGDEPGQGEEAQDLVVSQFEFSERTDRLSRA